MEIVKKTAEYTIYKKRSGRYGIESAAGKMLNGEEKVKILSQAKLIKLTAPKKKEEAPAAAPEAAAEATPAEPAKAE